MGVAQFFNNMAKAQSFGAGQYFGHGEYLLTLKSVELNPLGQKGPTFIAQFTIVETTNESDTKGTTRSWVTINTPQNKYFDADIKALFLALLGHDPAKYKSPQTEPAVQELAMEVAKGIVDSEYLEELRKAKSRAVPFVETLIGSPVRLTTFNKPTRAGGPFTKHVWGPAAS